jgi:hypothetical protein
MCKSHDCIGDAKKVPWEQKVDPRGSPQENLEQSPKKNIFFTF